MADLRSGLRRVLSTVGDELLRRQLAERDADIAHLVRQCRASAEHGEATIRLIAERDAVIAERDATIAAQDEYVGRAEAMVNEAQAFGLAAQNRLADERDRVRELCAVIDAAIAASDHSGYGVRIAEWEAIVAARNALRDQPQPAQETKP